MAMAKFPEGTLFIHGNATGADECCDEMASRLGYPRLRVPYFGFLGRSGGPVRNRYMLDVLLALMETGTEVAVEAFHDDLTKSKGTLDMVKRAKKAGVKVTLHRHKEVNNG